MDERAVVEPAEVRLGSGTAYGLISQVVATATNLLLSILIARLLGPQGKGMLAVVQQVPAVLLVLLNLGIATANLYYVSRGEVTAGTALANSLVLSVVGGIVGAPLVWLFLAGPLRVVPGIPLLAVVLAAVYLPVSLLQGWVLGIASGLGDLRIQTVYAIVSSAISTVVAVVLLFGGLKSISAVLAAALVGTVIGIAVLLFGIRTRLGPLRPDFAAARASARYAIKTHLGGIAGYLHLRQDVLILGWLAGAGSVGLYSVGVSFAELLWYVPSALAGAVIAKAPRVSHESGVEFMTRSARLSTVFMLVTGLASLLIVPPAIVGLFGRAFAPSSIVFAVLLPGAIATGIVRVVTYYQLGRGFVYWRQGAGITVFNVALNLVLIPRMGFVGAALASTITYTSYLVILLRLVKRDSGVTARDILMPRGEDVGMAWRALLGYVAAMRQPAA
jgi:O-antigen/teichoic acid export membrane protein